MSETPPLSGNAKRVLRTFFFLCLCFLYAPIVILVVFSFNDSPFPSLPLAGFTLRWYRELFANSSLLASLVSSAKVAATSSLITVCLAVVASIALVRRRFVGKPAIIGLFVMPLIVPYVVLGVSLLVAFRQFGVPLSLSTVVAGHVVLSFPYAILVLVPRLNGIDVRLEEAAVDLGARGIRVFRSITLPLILPAVVSAFLIGFTISFDEYAVASFLVGNEVTFPVYLFSQLRFPDRLPQVMAVAVIVMVFSVGLVLAAEVGRRRAERRLELGVPPP